jgi:hypothetical protein
MATLLANEDIFDCVDYSIVGEEVEALKLHQKELSLFQNESAAKRA